MREKGEGERSERGRETERTNGIRDSRCSTYNIISQTNICSLLRQLCHYGNVLHRDPATEVCVCVCVGVCVWVCACMHLRAWNQQNLSPFQGETVKGIVRLFDCVFSPKKKICVCEREGDIESAERLKINIESSCRVHHAAVPIANNNPIWPNATGIHSGASFAPAV